MTSALDGPPRPAPPGWYPIGDGEQLRWWDGWRWTDYVIVPTVRHPRFWERPGGRWRIAGQVLVACAALCVVSAAFSGYGDHYPVSRAGVAVGNGGYDVVNAACPGEHLREVTVWTTSPSGVEVALWHITGDVPMPDRFQIGSAPTGMTTVTGLQEPLDDRVEVFLKVTTSEVTTSDAMQFVPGAVPSSGVLSFESRYATSDAFTKSRLADVPCGDPSGQKAVGHFAIVAVSCGGAAGVLGAACILEARRRSRRAISSRAATA